MPKFLGDFHVHPLGHGPLPESLHNKNFTGPKPEHMGLQRKLQTSEQIEIAVRNMIQAAIQKGLHFMVNSDHVFNTSRIAQQIIKDDHLDFLIIPGFEASPISLDPENNHVVIAGVPPRPGQSLTGMTLTSLRRLANKHNALLILAHPEHRSFYNRGRLARIWDAMEICNCGFPKGYNLNTTLPKLAVTDAHDPQSLLDRPCKTLIEADELTQTSILQAVRQGHATPQC